MITLMGNNSVFINRYEHVWKSSSNGINYTCEKCGIHGYLPAKEMEAGVKSNEECDSHTVSSILVE